MYDTTDNENCYAGEPTTNLANTDYLRTIQFHNQGGYYNAGSTSDAPEKGPGWKKIIITDRGNNFRIAQFPYIIQYYGTTRVYSVEYDFGNTSGYFIYGDGSSGFDGYDNTPTKAISIFTPPSSGGWVEALFLGNNTPASRINDIIYYKNYQVEEKTHPTPYTAGTRSATQGLLPLIGNSAIDLSHTSFDSSAQINFDGSNSYIPLTPSMIPTNQITVEFVCKNNNPEGTATSIIAGGAADGNQDFNIHLPWGNVVYWDFGRPFNRIAKETTRAERTGFHHWVFTKNPSTGVMNIYLDGNLWHTDTGLTSTLPSITACSLGRYDRGDYIGYYYNGNVPVTKIYNRELTSTEVAQNYNKYKAKFNL
jgi:hypothetical protein